MDRKSVTSKSQFSRQTLPTTICCVCGAPIVANSVNTCARCLQSRHDITADLERQIVLMQCKRCERWQKDDATWTRADMESKELLGFCLKRLRNLRAVRLVDATFQWTEPHSRRIKMKLKVQKEVEKGVVLQQSCVIEYVIQPKMCSDCHRTEASLTWDSLVQLRQAVDHKRTFLYLEQLILKHNAQERAVRIDPQPEGVDFYFGTKSDGLKFLSFLDGTVPIRWKSSEKLITADLKSNVSQFNFSFSVEIAPVCKDDVVILPAATATHHGNMPRLCLCLHVGSVIRLIDPFTTRFCEVSSLAYWQAPFKGILDASRLTVFVVLDVMRVDDGNVSGRKKVKAEDDVLEEETEGDLHDDDDESQATDLRSLKQKKRRRKTTTKKFSSSARLSSKHALCEVEIAKEKDFGQNDERHIIRCHLGFVLKPGDYALGYDLRTCNFNYQEDEKPVEIPDILLVRKHYPRTIRMERKWKLKSITAEAPDQPGYGVGVKGSEGNDGRDMELFMRDLEEDKEMREKVNLYQRKTTAKKVTISEGAPTEAVTTSDWPPEVPLEELLTDMSLKDHEAEDDAEMDEEEGDDDDDESDGEESL